MLFDCHNHIHLGAERDHCLSTVASHLIPSSSSSLNSEISQSASTTSAPKLSGAAIMSTHPRDYSAVDEVCHSLRNTGMEGIPCYGTHPWFLHEMISSSFDNVLDHDNEIPVPYEERLIRRWNEDVDMREKWIFEIRHHLLENPKAAVGEIGLDGARWTFVSDDNQEDVILDGDDTNRPKKKVLACPMSIQQEAFEIQLSLAKELDRPVSIHAVRSWGPLMESLHRLASTKETSGGEGGRFPRQIYFHAFAGNPMIIKQLSSILCRKSHKKKRKSKPHHQQDVQLYFGFAPILHFQNNGRNQNKVNELIRAVGIHRILLETDLEDYHFVYDHMLECAQYIGDVLNLSLNDVLSCTYDNARRFYGFS